ncbi:hypothetical protein [Mesorhizobium amorphae]|uniref:hypothetical protein n=1 Tax=Mesorhizobium amorphae TaxID=71433 RepID=UPI001783AFF0|nr:hypothetical protein [Mesorhizobium amorphae]
MDISSARLTSLLREAFTPEALPSAKTDPARTALIKALVAPPAPAVGPSQPVAAVLPTLLPAGGSGMPQQLSSSEIEHAYRLLVDPGADAASDATPVTTATRRQAPEADTAQRGLALAQVTTDEGGKPIVMAWLALLTAEVSPLRRAPTIGSEARQGQRGSRPGDMAEPEPRQMSIGLMSFGAGMLACAIVGFVLMMLR